MITKPVSTVQDCVAFELTVDTFQPVHAFSGGFIVYTDRALL